MKYFKEAGLKIADYVIILTAAKHRLKPGGVHTGEGRGGDWNTEWDKYIEDHPEANRADIEKHLDKMKDKYGIR